MGCIPAGGQLQPSSTVGAKALSKKAQKIERKKKTSDTIKGIIPIMRPRWTRKVWCPKNVPSRITSAHHRPIVERTARRPIVKQTPP
jgi:hypothetical protein